MARSYIRMLVETTKAMLLISQAAGVLANHSLFIEVIRTGKVKARLLSNAMPWGYFRNLSDDDLKAIFAYLRTLKPIKHRVDNTEPPTYCRLCRAKHGFGNMN